MISGFCYRLYNEEQYCGMSESAVPEILICNFFSSISGCCYRLYNEEEYCGMSESTVPEILRCNLAAVLLQIMAMGIKDVHKFDFMNKPAPGRFQASTAESRIR